MHLKEIKAKAKNDNDKANEILFITMLENENRKTTLDEKLRETMLRKQ